MKRQLITTLLLICTLISFVLSVVSCEDADINAIISGIQGGTITPEEIEEYLNGQTPLDLYEKSLELYNGIREEGKPYSLRIVWKKTGGPNESALVKMSYGSDSFELDISNTSDEKTEKEKLVYKDGKMYYSDNEDGKYSYIATKEDVLSYVENSTVVNLLSPAFLENYPEDWFENQKFTVKEKKYSITIDIDEDKSDKSDKHSGFFRPGSKCTFNFTSEGELESIILKNVIIDDVKSHVELYFDWSENQNIDIPEDKDNYKDKGKFDKDTKPGKHDKEDPKDPDEEKPDKDPNEDDDKKEETHQHTFGEWFGTVSTCTLGGVQRRDCECGYSETRTTEPLGHDEVTNKAKEPTCTEEGNGEYVTCSRCSYTTYEAIEALGHDEVVHSGKTPTCTEAGYNEYVTCTRCDYTTYKDLAPLGHDMGEWFGNSATCTEGGTEEKECSRCEYNESRETEPLGHNFVDRICENCGTASLEYRIIIAGVELSEYALVIDADTGYKNVQINSFSQNLKQMVGYSLNTASADEIENLEYAFIIRYVSDAGDNGFCAYVDGNKFIVECSYANAFDAAFGELVSDVFFGKENDVSIDSDYKYEKCVSIVYYEDFGAAGNGVDCDFEAIYNTHIYANQCGQKVMGKNGSKYYISPQNFTKSVPVKTNIDFNGSTVIINDQGNEAFKNRHLPLFDVIRDNPDITFYDLDDDGVIDDERFKDVKITYDTDSFDWLVGVIDTKCLVRITNSNHKDFIRHGSNQDKGVARKDVFIVYPDGKISQDTPVAFEFDVITRIEIFSVDDAPITIKNGNFINIACRTVAATKYENKYLTYYRGFKFSRSNVTVENLNHRMQDEPYLGYYYEGSGYVEDELLTYYGSRYESYPYFGFLNICESYNISVTDTVLDAHTTYYENKPATATTGGIVPAPVVMGSYDLVIEYSSNVYFTNVTQNEEKGLGDNAYWGIMRSSGSKNLSFVSCKINRFDAHRGFWNATLKDTVIGHTLNITGGGTFIAENVKRLTGNHFINLRADYGASFRGDIILKDCVFEAQHQYNTHRGTLYYPDRIYSYANIINSGYSVNNTGWNPSYTNGAYWLWDFGYTCYMPENITIDNFTCAAADLNIFNELPDLIFEYNYDADNITSTSVKHPYQITKSVTLKNMTREVNVCRADEDDVNYSKLYSIPITYENCSGEN